MSKINYIGLRFNRYVILGYAEYKNGSRMVKAQCDCGVIKVVHLGALVRGTTKSCGCYKVDYMGTYAIKHGMWTHPLYNVWNGIKFRCLNKNSRAYKHYGGRGIFVHPEWEKDFKAFCDWAISNGWRMGLHLDRIDNDGGYTPNNCKFSTASQNCRNKRNNIFITYKGLKKTIMEWTEISGFPYHYIWRKYWAGWPPKKIFKNIKL